MPTPYIRHGLLVAAIILLLASFLPAIFGASPSIFGTEDTSWSRDFVFDFQTLITGALAVLAAYLTVVAGLENEARQQDRHEDTTALALRNDIRTVERALFPQLSDFAEIVDTRLWPTEYDPEDRNWHQNWAWMSEVSAEFLSDVFTLNAIIQRQQFQDGLLLFDGRLTRAYYVFTASYAVTNNLLTEHAEARAAGGIGQDVSALPIYENDFQESHPWRVATVIKFVDDAIALRNELSRAAEDYKKQVKRYGHRAGLSVTP